MGKISYIPIVRVSSCSGAVFRHVKTKDFLSDYIGIDIKQRYCKRKKSSKLPPLTQGVN
ncbi:hypothetical protein EXN66_Car000519 [Channa argus]|uniref:Uncharacterized protein n=1 Tax=Channa argus TaxID=215402 RepID=A0A6G1QZ39_CHAAH|nr:hypothetical protein EXN66_Car000519 [Channa argus]